MTILFTNNAATTLASGITNSATSLTVASGTGSLFPTLSGSNIFYATLQNASSGTPIEIVKVTARSTDTFTIVRAQDGTSASAFNSGDKVELRLPAIVLQDFPQLDAANTFSAGNTFNGSGNAFNGTLGATTPSTGKFTYGYSPNLTLTDAATIAWDTSLGQVATFTFVSTNRTVGAPTNIQNGAFYALAVIQNAGSNTLTWNSVFKFPGGTAPTLSTAASAKDYFVFRSDGTNLYLQGSSLGVA